MKNTVLVYLTKKENREYLEPVINEQFHCIYADSVDELYRLLAMDKEDIQVFISDIIFRKEEDLARILELYPVIIVTDMADEAKVLAAVEEEHHEIITTTLPEAVIVRRIRNMMKLRNLLELKNVVKEVVWDLVENNLQSLNICKCSKCKHDVLALTLNNVKPKYVVTQRGALISKTDYMSRTAQMDLITEIAKAARIVKENPRH